jgi:hypothetical protein
MSILFSGDLHASFSGEISTVTKKSLIKKYGRGKFSAIKYHIILGDGGFMWPGNQKNDLQNYKILARRKFPVFCVIGNHEPILGMNNLSETDIGIGETVYQIQDNPFVAYLKRGKIYYIDGFKFLSLGGALSVDKERQIQNKTWWEKEYWSAQEEEDILKLLETENTFDCVISHTGPHSLNKMIFEYSNRSDHIIDKVAVLNDSIQKRINFKQWWCGHLHIDIDFYDKETKCGYQYLYRSTKILEKVENKMLVFREYSKEAEVL